MLLSLLLCIDDDKVERVRLWLKRAVEWKLGMQYVFLQGYVSV